MELLADLLNRFISGEDRSKDMVEKIEGVLIENFSDSELYEEISVPVASYQPGGGEFLYDEEALAREFRYILKRLKHEGEIDG